MRSLLLIAFFCCYYTHALGIEWGQTQAKRACVKQETFCDSGEVSKVFTAAEKGMDLPYSQYYRSDTAIT